MAVGWASAFLVAIPLGALVTLIFSDGAQPKLQAGTWLGVAIIVLFAPILETLIMGGALLILLRFVSPTVAVVVSALGWALAHSAAAPAWGLVIWWPFVIFSTLFVTWRQRSLGAAFLVPAVTHALHNLLPALLLRFAPT